MKLKDQVAKYGGITKASRPTDTLGSLPIGDFHELKLKWMKSISGVYQITEIHEDTMSFMGVAVRDFYRNNVGMSYRAQICALTMLKIAESNRANPALYQQLMRVVRWYGSIVHEGGSLSGYTPKWKAFWDCMNVAISTRVLYHDVDADMVEQLALEEWAKDKGGSAEPERTWGLRVFKNRYTAERELGTKTGIMSGVNALKYAAKLLLDEEETKLTDAEWEIVLHARMQAVLVTKLEAQKDQELELVGKRLKNADLKFLDLTFEEVALVAGVIFRGSKGILAQSWNLEAVVDEDARGNFAKRLSDKILDKAFPRECVTKDVVRQLRDLHVRLAEFAIRAKHRKEQAQFEDIIGG